MNILVVGSSGYVGSNLVSFFSKNGKNRIFGISRIYHNNPLLEDTFLGDISDKSFLKKIVNTNNIKFDLIINCAAKTDHFGDKSVFYKDNVLGLKALLIELDGIYDKFIHISSEAVFLDGKLLNLSERSNLPSCNISEYSWSKKLAEEEILKFRSKYNCKVMIIRTRLIWGGINSVVERKLKSAIKKKIFFFVSGGNYLTPSTHIFNLYQGILGAYKYGANKGIYFIIDSKPIKFKVLVSYILNQAEFDLRILSLPRIIVFILCYLSDLLYKFSLKAVRPPLSMSLYYMTFSEVIIDDRFSRKILKYIPWSFEKLINEHKYNKKN